MDDSNGRSGPRSSQHGSQIHPMHRAEPFFKELGRKQKQGSSGDRSFISLCLKESSVYALNRIGDPASAFRRFVWFAVVLSGTVTFFYQFVQVLVAFYAYPVVVNVFTSYEPHQPFPAITICNHNSIRKEFWNCTKRRVGHDECVPSAVEDRPLTDIVIKTGNASEPSCEEASNLHKMNPMKTPQLYQWVVSSINHNDSRRYGHQVEDLVKGCRYYGSVCPTAYFTHSYSWNYGNCYTLDVSSTALANKSYFNRAGPETGLEIELDLETAKYAHFTANVGARIQIHDPLQPPGVDCYGLNLLPGHNTFIGVTKTVMESLPPPYPDRCKDYASNDSQELCKEGGSVDRIASRCSCSLLGNLHPDLRSCDLFSHQDFCCILEAVREPDSSKECPAACKVMQYDLQVSSTFWPSDAAYHHMNRTGNEALPPVDEFRRSHLSVQVYFDTFDSMTTKQSPLFHDAEVLNTIGSQLGLWLGLSLISLFEFGEKIFLFFKYKMFG